MSYKCIVCGVTSSAHAQKAALEAAALAKKDNAKLVFVYAVDSSFMRKGLMVEISHTSVEGSLEKLGNVILDNAEELIKSIGVTPKKVVRKGEPLQVLKEVAIEEKADLLMIGHEERTTIERAILKGEVEKHAEELEKAAGVKVSIIR